MTVGLAGFNIISYFDLLRGVTDKSGTRLTSYDILASNDMITDHTLYDMIDDHRS